MAGATIRLIGPLIKKLKGLNSKKETIDAFLKSKTAKNPKNKTQKVAAEKRKEKIVKSMERIKKQAVEAKTTSKDGQRLATEEKLRKRQAPDSAKALQFSDPKDAQMARMGSYAGRNKEMVRLREAIKKAKEKTNLSDKAKEELKRNEVKLKDMIRRLGKPADEKKAGGPIIKKAVGGKVYSNIVSRKTGGAIGVGAALRGFGKGYKKG